MVDHKPKPKVIVICGPTGIGKTSVAITLANGFNAEIISADSMQIYCRMDIGTAKPSPEVLDAYPHRLINVREPCESYSAGEFCRDAVAHT